MLVKVNNVELTRLRKEAGLSMHRLSIEAGLSKNAVQKMENESRKSSLLRVKAIADRLGVEYSVLIATDTDA